MSDPITIDRAFLADAAECRAEGATWASAAKQLGTDVLTLRAAVRSNRRLWRKLMSLARADVAAEAADEAVHCLRGQLRSEDEKVVLNAAGWLLRYQMTAMRHARPKPKPKKEKAARPKGKSGRELPEVSEEGMWTQHYIESLSPAEYEKHMDECVDSYRREKAWKAFRAAHATHVPGDPEGFQTVWRPDKGYPRWDDATGQYTYDPPYDPAGSTPPTSDINPEPERAEPKEPCPDCADPPLDTPAPPGEHTPPADYPPPLSVPSPDPPTRGLHARRPTPTAHPPPTA